MVGYNDEAFFIEVHPADTKNVDEMIKKVVWLKEWLAKTSPLLLNLHKNRIFYWIPSGRVRILKNSSQYKRIAANNLQIANKLIISPTGSA